ncbi:MAG TPA: DRTGG domain-containing protein [Bacteroidales bacterium]|nr:DRTGG domain-containing protein [Bacteroidales bacterium]
MNLTEVVRLTNAEVVAGSVENENVETGFCSDLMSDVLTLDTDNMLLITGMSNLQAIRTAEMADIRSILLVRGKRATPEMIQLADESNMVIMETTFSMFNAAGILHAAGLKAVY